MAASPADHHADSQPPISGLACSPGATRAIGEGLAGIAEPGRIVALEGDLGAGKTQLVRGLAAGLGLAPESVSSPSFVLVTEHEAAAGRPPLVHADVYRAGSPEELATAGWDPVAGGGELVADAVVAVEWAELLETAIEGDVLWLRLEHVDETTRRLCAWPGGAWSRDAGRIEALFAEALEREEETA